VRLPTASGRQGCSRAGAALWWHMAHFQGAWGCGAYVQLYSQMAPRGTGGAGLARRTPVLGQLCEIAVIAVITSARRDGDSGCANGGGILSVRGRRRCAALHVYERAHCAARFSWRSGGTARVTVSQTVARQRRQIGVGGLMDNPPR